MREQLDPRSCRRRRARRVGGRGPEGARGPPRAATSSCAETSSPSTASRRRRGRPRGRARAVGADRARARDRPGNDRGGHVGARPAREPVDDPRRRRLDAPRQPGRAEDRQPEALRRLDPQQHDHVRDRPGRHGQDLPRDGDGDRRALATRGQPHHPHAPGGRGRRAARLPARHDDGEGRPLPASAVRRALRHARGGPRQRAPRARRDRGRAAGIHARQDPE